MGIVKKPVVQASDLSEKDLNRFVNNAPDSLIVKRVKKGNKIQILLTLLEEKLAKLDSLALNRGLSRACLINLGIDHILESGVTLDGLLNKE
jgi:hypothetical protein